MPVSFAPITSVPPVAPDLVPAAPAGGTGFQGALENAIQSVETSQNAGAQAVDNFLSGEGGELHSTILAVQRASLSFDLFLQVRNKAVSAYQEIMRMQV
ncbi:MAG TPA: flagellar hook-basal body complex protein FliE [Bryobacteraceae bacterium]|nr:flagellar hook-basal body complex protein FliE [Bryobacteraceae bacterium]